LPAVTEGHAFFTPGQKNAGGETTMRLPPHTTNRRNAAVFTLTPIIGVAFESVDNQRMPSCRPLSFTAKTLLVLTAVYFAASLAHFAHNAEFLCEYPKLPAWLTSAKVYGAWAAVTAVGAAGLVFMRRGWMIAGLALIAVYGSLGFDGLGHYAVAPMALHPLGANVTILAEVAAGAVLLAFSLYAMARERWGRGGVLR
jgi:hypothetical protein